MTDDNKRYPLVLPQELWNQVQKASEEKNISAAEFTRRSLKLTLMAVELEKTPGDGLIARKNGKNRKFKVFPKSYYDDDSLFPR
jgi:hypothetical protein